MIWDTLIVASELSDPAIRDYVAYAFDIDPSEVAVIHGQEEFPNPCTAKVVCLVQRRTAGFRTIIELVTMWDHEPDHNIVIPRFVLACQSDTLFAGDLPGDTMYTHVRPDCSISIVYVDDNKLNESDEYHIVDHES